MEWIEAMQELQQRVMQMNDAALKLGKAQLAVVETLAVLWRHALAHGEMQQGFLRALMPR